MAPPPLQTALLAFLVGIAFVDVALGLHHLAPFIVPGFNNAQLLKSKLVTSQRTEILNVHRVLLAAPLWFFATIGVSYLLLFATSLYNAATDSARRITHILTFVVAVAALVPLALKFKSPALSLRKTGKLKLKADQEVQALYDIGFVVLVDGGLFLLALLSNLEGGGDDAVPEAAPKKKKASKKVVEEKEEKLE
ncbi:hypothetical protein CcCBS67573_g00917 [Chytriomyces confervae]|uniref:Uncharacterized protein n=1 Tax=Chytriomyces confervae TaxID=246404 RepID=A0A507FPY8_9FUNG|nr:hypothetical protein HDU80_003609 [Chytriomyces hyalinus]TPX77770.1 hypothetical protein CcCBS67573_g00917 [Chytriomyces confervae]